MSDDLRARLDDAIKAARDGIWQAIGETDCTCGRSGHLDYCASLNEAPVDAALDHYTALVELRARWDEHAEAHTPILGQRICTRCDEIEADVRRLLPVAMEANAST